MCSDVNAFMVLVGAAHCMQRGWCARDWTRNVARLDLFMDLNRGARGGEVSQSSVNETKPG